MAGLKRRRRTAPAVPHEGTVRALYRAAAVSNALATVPAFVAYDRYVATFTDERPRYPFLVHIWAGMAALWGVSFWEIARDPVAARRLVRYSWLEKAVTTTSVVAAHRRGEVPTKFLVAIVATDLVWIPPFLWADRVVRRAAR
ncbi:MAG: hypothetical protein AB7L84_06335 [Acidimicrobiia bacterium]